MKDRPLFPTADQLTNDVRRRLDAWRAEMQECLTQAKTRYRETLAELEAVSRAQSPGSSESLPARLEALRRSRELQQIAAEFDTGIARLSDAMECLDAAVGAMEGKKGLLALPDQSAEVSLEAVAIQAQEEERYRLAREIHDGPAQILANVALQLEYVSKLATKDPARAKDELVAMQRDLRLAVGEVRRFMYDLRPPALAQQGVGPAVESHCQRLAERFGMKIAVQWNASAMLPPPQDTAVFRIVQEALQNVVKHAQATAVEVLAAERDGYLEVSVADNGRGFDAEQVRRLDPKHFGLAGMRARAQQIGATLEVSSVSDRGTRVLLKVPITS
ncbi:MAG: sensor histidine kinase [Sphingomonadaceae bacterium]